MRIALALLVLVFGAGALRAQTVTALKTGEVTTGMTKQCYYEYAGTRYTQTFRSIDLCPLSIRVRTTPATAPVSTPPARLERDTQRVAPQRATVTAFKTGEQSTGLTKQCYYTFGSNQYTKTVQSTELCPLSIRVTL
jgi:hypothetical protein